MAATTLLRQDAVAALEAMKLAPTEEFDLALEHEVQTDKPRVKLVPCRECKRPLVVTTFFAPAKAQCSACKPGADAGSAAKTATVGVPIPGSTLPSKAVDLTRTLINKTFANALCPVHPDDESHVMELKYVNHNENYGPSEQIGVQNGKALYRQLNPGETVLHQCLKCKATVTYSTTAQSQFRRINEVRPGKNQEGIARILGTRDGVEATAAFA